MVHEDELRAIDPTLGTIRVAVPELKVTSVYKSVGRLSGFPDASVDPTDAHRAEVKGLVGFQSRASQPNQDSEPLQPEQSGERELCPSLCFRTRSAGSDRIPLIPRSE
jgi:hypothetical protein